MFPKNWKKLLLGFLWSLTCATHLIAQTTEPDEADLVHYGDLLEVDVVGSFDFDWRGTLNPEGFLNGLDHADQPIYALCRSGAEIASDVEKQYSKILRNPKIEVRILDRSNRAVTHLGGAVRFPQRLQIRRTVRLNELLIIAGGITDRASGEISIFRPEKLSCRAKKPEAADEFIKTSQASPPQTKSIKIRDLLRGVDEANPEILSGDIVTVLEAFPIYVIGGVNAPKQISSRSQMTLTRAIASAGGLARDAIAGTVTIFRREGGATRIIETNLDLINAGKSEDPVLKAFDIVEVPQKGRSKNKRAPVIDSLGSKGADLTRLPLRIVD